MKIIMGILSWILKNTALVIGILEAILKVFAGIVSLTPTKTDDKLLPIVDNVFSWIKKALYTISDKMAGKIVTEKN